MGDELGTARAPPGANMDGQPVLFVLFSIVVAGCSSDPAVQSRDGAVEDLADALPRADDAATNGVDGGALANPPPGYVLCGSGSFTQADSYAACSAFIGGPRECDAVTITAGKWQAYCESAKTKVYFWVEIEGARQPGNGCVPKLARGRFALSDSSGGEWGTVVQSRDSAFNLSDTATCDGVIAPFSPSNAHAGTLIIGATLGTVAGSYCDYSNPNDILVIAFEASWT